MGFKQMMLGYLLDSPSYGYEIMKKAYSDFYPAGPEVNEGLLYSTLKKLEAEGLATREAGDADTPTARRKVTVTPEGLTEFKSWLLADDDAGGPKFDFFARYPFLEKCNYFKYLSPDESLDSIDREIQKATQRLDSYRLAEKSMVQKGIDRFRIAIIQYGISNEELRLNWLQGLKELIENEGGRTE
ncbi:MAG: PadR family transcriptional regulator [Deltaproteobacteria bacterium]